ncbi:hypothetical protein [Micromonospora sp. NPDC049891]|uniref:hypothetical protein n=1 Tax=Micromonospora sp. NPDC049891 TaxID=3155655 RepID=UPI0033BFD94F
MTAAVATPPTPVPAPPVRLGVPCPTCGDLLPGLLALCLRPECIRAFLDDDARYDQ